MNQETQVPQEENLQDRLIGNIAGITAFIATNRNGTEQLLNAGTIAQQFTDAVAAELTQEEKPDVSSLIDNILDTLEIAAGYTPTPVDDKFVEIAKNMYNLFGETMPFEEWFAKLRENRAKRIAKRKARRAERKEGSNNF